MTQQYPAGWFPDPTGRFEYRYFNGVNWTADVAAGGQRGLDPLVAATPRRGFAIASLVLGIVSIVLGIMPLFVYAGLVCLVLAVVFGAIALQRARRSNGAGRRLAVWGVCLAIAAAPVSVVGISTTGQFIDDLRLAFDSGPADVTIPVCETRKSTPYAEVVIRNIDTSSHAYRVKVSFVETVGSADDTIAIVNIDVPSLSPGASKRYRATATVPVVHELRCTYTMSGPVAGLP